MGLSFFRFTRRLRSASIPLVVTAVLAFACGDSSGSEGAAISEAAPAVSTSPTRDLDPAALAAMSPEEAVAAIERMETFASGPVGYAGTPGATGVALDRILVLGDGALPFLERLAASPSAVARMAAAKGLSEIRVPEARALLSALAADMAEALVFSGCERSPQTVQAIVAEMAVEAIERMERFQDGAVGEGGSPGQTGVALDRILALGAGAMPFLERLATSPSPVARMAAARGLATQRSRDAAAILSRLTADEGRGEVQSGCEVSTSTVGDVAAHAPSTRPTRI